MIVPVGYDAAPTRPRTVLYLLHGANGDETSWTPTPASVALTAPYNSSASRAQVDEWLARAQS